MPIRELQLKSLNLINQSFNTLQSAESHDNFFKTVDYQILHSNIQGE